MKLFLLLLFISLLIFIETIFINRRIDTNMKNLDDNINILYDMNKNKNLNNIKINKSYADHRIGDLVYALDDIKRQIEIFSDRLWDIAGAIDKIDKQILNKEIWK